MAHTDIQSQEGKGLVFECGGVVSEVGLVQADGYVTAYSGCEVDFCFEVEFNTDHEGGSFQVSVLICCAFEESACCIH